MSRLGDYVLPILVLAFVVR